MFTRPVRRVLFALFCSVTCSLASGENWTRFRGPDGQSISHEKELPLKWTDTENVIWKTAIPGLSWSSPIVFDDKVFVTTATEEGTSCHVICVDRRSGDVIWNTKVHAQQAGPKRKANTYASPTPVTDGQQVYAVFADGTAVAVDFQGNRVWKNSDIKFHSLHGLGASPILVGDQLIMPFDGSSPEDKQVGWKVPWANAVVVSYDCSNGKIRWRGKRGKSRVGHVTPIVVQDGQTLISSGGDRVQGFDPQTGKRIWSVYSQGEGVTPSPVVHGDVIYTSSGFEEPTLRAIRLGGSGDVTDTHIIWEQTKGVPVLASPLYVHPNLYTITRDNILHCIQADSGEIVWLKRLSGDHWASPVLADGKIYVLSQDGVTLVLRPGEKYDEIARNDLGEKCLASMAVSQGDFFIRSEKNLYRIGKPAKQ